MELIFAHCFEFGICRLLGDESKRPARQQRVGYWRSVGVASHGQTRFDYSVEP